MPSATILDSLWVLVSAFLVFFMHAGFSLVESGFCRRKNAAMIITKNFSVVAVASILFYLIGFGLMFGDGNGWWGFSGFIPSGNEVLQAAPESLPLFVFLFFQMVFAATAATIVSGAVAERSKLWPFMFFVVVASAIIYPIVGHWVWGGGFLATLGFHDFAGSTVVHGVGGAMALAGVLAVGPRRGKYAPNGSVRPIPAHNLPLAALGVLILWLGWFGFNGGSTLAADAGAIAPVILVTNLAAAAGFVGALLYVRMRTGMLDLSLTLNGALAGLVAITAGADVIGPLSALIVGALGGIIVIEGVFLLDRLQIDDPVGAIPVHLFNGLFGTIAVGLFASGDDVRGLFFGGGFGLLGKQLLGALVGAGFAYITGLLVWYAMRWSVGVRVTAEHEWEGLDQSECGVEAYGIDPDTLGARTHGPGAH